MDNTTNTPADLPAGLSWFAPAHAVRCDDCTAWAPPGTSIKHRKNCDTRSLQYAPASERVAPHWFTTPRNRRVVKGSASVVVAGATVVIEGVPVKIVSTGKSWDVGLDTVCYGYTDAPDSAQASAPARAPHRGASELEVEQWKLDNLIGGGNYDLV